MDVMRLLAPLSAIAAISLLLALVAGLTARPVNVVKSPQTLIEGLGAQLGRATRLEVTHGLGLSGSRTFSFKRQSGQEAGQWLFEQRDNYPAHQELVTETLLALASLQLLEARTARADWHRALGLVVPEDLGKAIRFRVLDDEGRELAAMLLGGEEKSEAEAKQRSKSFGPVLRNFYVRREGENQSWVARGRLPRNRQAAAWLSPDLPRGPRVSVQQIAFNGRRFAIAKAGQAWLERFYNLRPEDVTGRTAIDVATGKKFILHYQDALTIEYTVVGAGTVIWLVAVAKGPEAKKINQRFANYAFRFPASAAPILFPDAAYFGG